MQSAEWNCIYITTTSPVEWIISMVEKKNQLKVIKIGNIWLGMVSVCVELFFVRVNTIKSRMKVETGVKYTRFLRRIEGGEWWKKVWYWETEWAIVSPKTMKSSQPIDHIVIQVRFVIQFYCYKFYVNLFRYDSISSTISTTYKLFRSHKYSNSIFKRTMNKKNERNIFIMLIKVVVFACHAAELLQPLPLLLL